MLGTGQGGGECCGKAIGEVNPSTLGKNNLVKINSCCVVFIKFYLQDVGFYIIYNYYMKLKLAKIITWFTASKSKSYLCLVSMSSNNILLFSICL